MPAALEKRLIRLEDHRGLSSGWQPPFQAATRLLALLLAVHLGDLQPGEPVEDGEARALGHDDRHELRAAMLADGGSVFGWSCRHAEACERLLAMRDADVLGGMDRVAAALSELVADLPAAFRAHACATASGAIDEAAEWLCL